jgi:hypothetical protein
VRSSAGTSAQSVSSPPTPASLIHVYIHTYIHAYTHTCIHTYR